MAERGIDWISSNSVASHIYNSQPAGLLPYHHKDPADRFIIATAIHHDMKIVSFDGVFPSYNELNDRLITENL
jgi:PIN domain nuclease of toxin-antitoxin system